MEEQRKWNDDDLVLVQKRLHSCWCKSCDEGVSVVNLNHENFFLKTVTVRKK
jgi:hypothetical protein